MMCEATIHVERDTDYTPFQRLLMWVGMYLPNSIENWISSFLPESTYEVEVLISGDVTPVREGRFYGPPELCYPSEGGDIDITSAYVVGSAGSASIDCLVNVRPFELFGREFEIATKALWEAANDEWEAAAEDAAVSRYEARENYGL